MFHHSISMKYKDFLKGKGPITDDVPSIGLWTAFEIPCNYNSVVCVHIIKRVL